MLFKDRLDRLGAVASHLPFALEDYDAANAVFSRWTREHDDDALRTVEIWLYCYVQQYVLLRLLRLSHVSGGEADRLIALVFDRAHKQLDRVTDPERFTHWVSVVCRNTFLNGLRRFHQRTDADDTVLDQETEEEPGFEETDRALVRHAVGQAIEGLPESIRPVAQMRFLEGRSYGHIAAATGHSLPTVRAYAAKAVTSFRQHPGLRVLAQELDLIPP